MGLRLGNRVGDAEGTNVGYQVGMVGFNEYDGDAVVGTTDGADDTVGDIDGISDGADVGV